MAENKIIGYKKMFGFVLPDWVDEKTIRYVATALLSIAVMFLILIFLVWPNLTLIETKNSELTAATSSLNDLKNSKQGIDKMQSQLSSKEQEIILTAIPQQYSPETAIYLLRGISNDSGVAITSYSLPSGTLFDSTSSQTNKAATGDMVNFSTFPIRLSVEAPVDALLNFISKVESSLPFGVVSDLNLQEVTKLSKSVGGKSVQLSLEIMFYQSSLGSVNINRVQTFTDEDISLAKDLTRYNVLSTQAVNLGVAEATGSGTSTGSVFGF